MTHLPDRVLNVLIGVDETANALLGGKPQETISGTIGRALLEPSPPLWAKASRALVDGIFGPGHCVLNAKLEQARRDADYTITTPKS